MHPHSSIGILQSSGPAGDDTALKSTVENVADVHGDVEVDARHHGRGVEDLGAEVG